MVGGHAGATILPLFSQDAYASQIPPPQVPALDARVQNGGTEVVDAKQGTGTPLPQTKQTKLESKQTKNKLKPNQTNETK